VKGEYVDRYWEQEVFDRFIQKTQQVADGGEKRIPETYFNIVEPGSVTVDEIIDDFEDQQFNEDARGEERAGFKYSVFDDDNEVRATYVFVNEEKKLTASGEVDHLVTEKSVGYRIHPDEQLLIVESTYPPDVQRTKKIFRVHTDMTVTVLGNIPANYSEAEGKIGEFLDTFERRDLEENNE
jgi:hypothetical protein